MEQNEVELDAALGDDLARQLKEWIAQNPTNCSRWKTALEYEQASEEIMAEQAYLERMLSTTDSTVLTKHEMLAAELQRLQDEQHQICQSDNSADKSRLEKKRLDAILDAMDTINIKLDEVYKFLTSEEREARCAYSRKPEMLFQDGITLKCKPKCQPADTSVPQQRRHVLMDGAFSLLSFGQQQIAMLALSFAIQAAFPCPFYFLDEIDSGLDKRKTGRLLEYIKAQKDAQYFIVSHKPEVRRSPISPLLKSLCRFCKRPVISSASLYPLVELNCFLIHTCATKNDNHVVLADANLH